MSIIIDATGEVGEGDDEADKGEEDEREICFFCLTSSSSIHTRDKVDGDGDSDSDGDGDGDVDGRRSFLLSGLLFLCLFGLSSLASLS
mmetsp:Transcript_16223/g.29226  ORF Transcript_16223/g.29226 Transcript_16223/m.29226 type:complete len:88 (+) Transcript_16223:135-398(+)